jgi:peptidoglycan hydrolase FlgJ
MDLPPVTTAQFPAGQPSPKPATDDVTVESARKFEAMFLGQMVDEMLATVDLGDFGGGHAEETWRSFLSDAIGRSIAEQNSTGIARGIEAAIQRYHTGAKL